MRIVIAMNLTADNKKAQCDKEKMECEERPMTVSLDQNIGMMVYWTIQSVFIRYFLRRFFEKRL